MGIGLGYNSLDSFLNGHYWDGIELYIDEQKELYKHLKLGKQNVFGLADRDVLRRKKEADDMKVEGNMSGDGLTMGGTYVIDKGGEILMEFQQKKFGDHPELEVILDALGIPREELSEMRSRL